MHPNRRKQLEVSVSDMEAENRSNQGTISRYREMLQYAERGSQHAKDLQQHIENLQLNIKHNKTRISEIQRELQG